MISFPYLLGFIIGIAAGLYYFFGLWFTVRKIPNSAKPGLLMAASFAVRLVPVLMVMFFTAQKDPGMFFAVLVGFFGVRFFMIRKVSKAERKEIHAAQS